MFGPSNAAAAYGSMYSQRQREIEEEERLRREQEQRLAEENARKQEYLENGRGTYDEHPTANRQAEVEGEYRVPNVDERFHISEPGNYSDPATQLEQFAAEDAMARRQERDAHNAKLAAAEQVQFEAEEAELAKLQEKPKMRERVLRAMATGLSIYASEDPGAAAAGFMRQFADENRLIKERMGSIYERRAKAAEARAARESDHYFQSTLQDDAQDHSSIENSRTRRHSDQQATTEYGRQLTRDDINYGRQVERDTAQFDHDLTKQSRQFDHDLNIVSREEQARARNLAAQHGYNMAETEQRMRLQNVSARAEWAMKELGVDAAAAESWSQAVETGQWDQTTRETGLAIQEAQKSMIALEKGRQRIAQMSAAKGLTVPVYNEQGGIQLDRSGRPLEIPLGVDDAVSGKEPRYVQRGKAIERMDAQAPDATGGAGGLQGQLDALLAEHDIETVRKDIQGDKSLPPQVRDEALAYLESKRAQGGGAPPAQAPPQKPLARHWRDDPGNMGDQYDANLKVAQSGRAETQKLMDQLPSEVKAHATRIVIEEMGEEPSRRDDPSGNIQWHRRMQQIARDAADTYGQTYDIDATLRRIQPRKKK